MSRTLDEKIQILNSLDEKHLAVLNALMADKDVKIPALAKELGYSVSTVRNFLTDIYKACEVPDGEEDKRGYLIRGYAEAYLKKDRPIQRPVEPPEKPLEFPDEIIEEQPIEVIKPVMHINPQPPRMQITPTMFVIGLFVVSIIVVIVLASALKGMNSPNAVNNQPTFPGYYSTFEDIPLATGVILGGGNYGGGTCDTTESYWTQSLSIENSSGYDYDLSITGTKFSLVDNFGRSYRLLSAEIVGPVDEDKEWRRIYSGHYATIMLCWLDRPNYSDADYVDLKIMGLTNGGSDIIIRNVNP